MVSGKSSDFLWFGNIVTFHVECDELKRSLQPQHMRALIGSNDYSDMLVEKKGQITRELFFSGN